MFNDWPFAEDNPQTASSQAGLQRRTGSQESIELPSRLAPSSPKRSRQRPTTARSQPQTFTPAPLSDIGGPSSASLKKSQRQQDLTQTRSFTAQTAQSRQLTNAAAALQIGSGAQGGTQGNRSSSPSSRGSSNDIPVGPANLNRESVVLPPHLQPTIVDTTRGAPSRIPKGKYSAGGWI